MLTQLSRFRLTIPIRLNTTIRTQGFSSSSPAMSKPPLPLPGPEEESSDRNNGVATLRVGESVRLDALGPLVVNNDGSMGRVGNWAGMTEPEKENTLRILGRRNKQRLEALKKKMEAEEAAKGK